MKFLPNTIVYFHEVQDQKWLINNIELLTKNYNIISLQELENFYYGNKELKNSCHITFDDGDITFYNNALPIIKKYKIPVSTYVSPLIAHEGKNFWFQEIKGYDRGKMIQIIKKVTRLEIDDTTFIDVKSLLKKLEIEVILEIIDIYQRETKTLPKNSMNMNSKQLVEVKSTGLVDIGAHTLNHPLLINETDENSSKEIIESIDLLSDILGSNVKHFVYPNGNYSDREIEILKKKDIKLAFTTERGKISHSNNPLCIPRSGSPVISELSNSNAYIFSKCLVQLLAGEKRYYKFADTWNTVVSKIY